MVLPGVQLHGHAAFTLKTVATGTTCEGIPIDGAPTGQQWCWTGGVMWKEAGIMEGFFDGSYLSLCSLTCLVNVNELQVMGDSKDLDVESADLGTAAPENPRIVVNSLCKNYVHRNYGCGSSLNTTALDLLSFRSHDEIMALLGVTMICALYRVSNDNALTGERRWQDHLYKHLNWQCCDEFW